MLALLSVLIAQYILATQAHTVITYPGWRGNNLDITDEFPYGMQWSYPCGGIPATQNRTKWPLSGGGIAIQPGWFTGHASALFYINIGLGTSGPSGGPPNESFPLVERFEVHGPSNNPYQGTFCLPQVGVPKELGVKVGDLATVQVIETTRHGGALYNCVDIIFAEAVDVAPLNATNCFNSTDISFGYIYSRNISESMTQTMTALPTTCTPCPAFATSSACPTQTACPSCNGMSSVKDGVGMGLPLGVLALGVLGL